MMKGDWKFYCLLADAADAGPRGRITRQDPKRYAELRGRLMNLINGTPEEILVDYANYLHQACLRWRNTCDSGDLQVYAASRRAYREFLHCTGIDPDQVATT